MHLTDVLRVTRHVHRFLTVAAAVATMQVAAPAQTPTAQAHRDVNGVVHATGLNEPSDNGGPVRSFFRNAPGNRTMAFDSIHFAGMMPATASGGFVDTHFHDYASGGSYSPEFPGPIDYTYP